MIVHVWRRAVEAGIGPVAVATDSADIAQAVIRAGGQAIMTRADHASGSDRIFEALEKLDPEGRHDVVVNVRNRDTARADLALVASCGDRNYPQAKDASTRPECDAALGAHETRSQP